MKRFIQLLAIVSLFSLNSSYAQLQNGGLEVWVNDTFKTSFQGLPVTFTSNFNRPAYWMTPNKFTKLTSSVFSIDESVTRKDTNSFAGQYAARLETKEINIMGQGTPVPGALTNGDFDFDPVAQNIDIFGGTEVTARPSRVTGYFQYDSPGNDSLLVSIVARYWDQSSGQAEIVGQGTWFYSGTQTTYKKFSVPVEYTSCQMPDTVLISILGSASMQGTPGTVAFIDSIQMDTLSPQDNLPPIALDDDTATTINTSVDVEISSNDKDCDGSITQLPTIVSQPSNGTVSNITNNTVTYQPDQGFSGNDSFTYSITDDQNAQDTATVDVFVNSAPLAVDDGPYTVFNNSTARVMVTTNDSDPEGNDLVVSSIVTQPSNGSAMVLSDDSISYSPNAGYTGNDQLEYVVCDEVDTIVQLCDTATVTFDVDKPVGIDDRTKETRLNVYPNPTKASIYFDVKDHTANQQWHLTITDITGRQLKTVTFTGDSKQVDVKEFSNGIYLYQLRNDSGAQGKQGKFTVAR